MSRYTKTTQVASRTTSECRIRILLQSGFVLRAHVNSSEAYPLKKRRKLVV